MNYLTKILNATVYDVAKETPLDEAASLSKKHGCRFLLKREDLQPVHSYKIRGAYNKMSQLSRAELDKGVVCASAGNHAQGVALSAQRLGVKATIVMPVTTPEIKTSAVKAYGASIVLHGDSYSDTYEELHRQIEEHGYTYIAPFDDPDVIAGQGTVGKEILDQAGRDLTAVFVPIGGGGLAAGVSVYVKSVRPWVKVYGVEPEDSDCMYRSIKAGRRVSLDNPGLFADGVCVKEPGKETFRLCRENLDGIVRVTTAETCAAIKDIFEATRAICEPAGALALAAAKKTAKKGETYACVISGANMNFDRIRFVSELTETGEGREAVFDCAIPEQKGSFSRFIKTIGRHSVTEFNYRMGEGFLAHVFVGISVKDVEERKELRRRIRAAGFHSIDLTDDTLAREHVRYMVGGRSASITNEVVYAFEFPERPGALYDFLSVIAGRWNISLFHYRNHGADHGKVLCGFQVPKEERDVFVAALDEIGYSYVDVTSDPAYKYFLGNRSARTSRGK
ncbi:MAG: threonine ammonia-lyase, biosynthetic [Kiritimatiellae bacterium]|nr:threonine ammonia-lyase, biosynthetic [Kiritimatiellia bacterium]